MKQIILASGSPRRHQLLNMIGLPHRIVPSDVDEDIELDVDPADYARHLSIIKAQDVASKTQFDLLIAADTIVVLHGEILGKPRDQFEAGQILRKLSGNTHEVITAVTILNDSGESTTFHELTKVTFAELSDLEIDHYIQTGSPMDKAGAYGIQDDLGSLFVSRIDGDYYNVVGLPVHRLYHHLNEFVPLIAKNILSGPQRSTIPNGMK